MIFASGRSSMMILLVVAFRLQAGVGWNLARVMKLQRRAMTSAFKSKDFTSVAKRRVSFSQQLIMSRRKIIRDNVMAIFGIAASVNFLPTEISWAFTNDGEMEETTQGEMRMKPSAPLEKLIPAARVKWTIDKATQVALTMQIKEASGTNSNLPNADRAGSWELLRQLILLPQNYTSGTKLPDVPLLPGKMYLEAYQRNREKLNGPDQLYSLLVQAGEIGVWRNLKQQERKREEEDEIRAALNIYTSALSFRSDFLQLNVPLAERKQFIREDRVPDVKQVIQSDMGLRYLYRNELLTAMLEVREELQYQLRNSQQSTESNSASVQDLVPLLLNAQVACKQWFSLIEERDVQDAMALVLEERMQQSVVTAREGKEA